MALTIPERLGDFASAVALGTVRNTNGSPYVPWTQNAERHAVTTADTSLTSLGNAYHFPTAPVTVRIKAGGSTDDIADGLGARSVRLTGLDSNGNLYSEVLATNGANASELTTEAFWRVFLVDVVDVGVYGGSNNGDITIETQGGTIILGTLIGEGLSQHGSFSVPVDHTALITGLTISVESAKAVSFEIWARPNLTDVVAPFSAARLVRHFGLISAGIWPIPIKDQLVMPELTDLWIVAKAQSSTSDASAAGEFLLVPNR